MATQWFKFYGGDYLSDPKIERLSPLERSCWITILCMASMGTNGVIEFLTVESLLNRSGIQFDPYHPEEWEKALSVLVKFKNLKMINTNDEGQITVLNWSKRQEHNLTVAERVAKHRKNDNGDDNGDDNAISLSNDNDGRPMTNYERLKRHRQRKAILIDDNENVTTDVTNVTTEENRIEENKRDFAKPKSLPSKEITKGYQYPTDTLSKGYRHLPIEEITEATTKSERKPSDKRALALREWAYGKLEAEHGVRPITTIADYVRIVAAFKVITESDIKTMVEDAIEAGKAQTVRGILTDRLIDLYRQENL